MDFALLFDGERTIWGIGESQRIAHQEEGAFYLADFAFQEASWVSFEKQGVSTYQPEFGVEVPYAAAWNCVDESKFLQIWSLIEKKLSSPTGAQANDQDLNKIVLAVNDTATQVQQRVLKIPKQPYFYAFRLGNTMAWGLSPELLFRVNFENHLVETMALAGTRSSTEAMKREEITLEHELVVKFFDEVAAKNKWILERTPAHWRDFGSIQHLESLLKFRGAATDDLAALVREFHPTPALGVYPRNVDTLTTLAQLRTDASLPSYYGAPFGVCSAQSATFIVMIRGHFFENGILSRPIGVGVTSASAPAREWQEVQLKRQSMEKLWIP